MLVQLPWPNSALLPNRKHGRAWQASYAAAMQAHEDACMATRSVILESPLDYYPDEPLELTINFYPPDNRGRDVDGMLSSLKPALDGIAHALGVNDKMFTVYHLLRHDPIKGGRVTVQIEALIDIPF